jgi:hypothetical protein
LSATVNGVDFPGIDIERYATQRRDRVHDQERSEFVAQLAELLDRLPGAGRGFGLDDGQHLGPNFAERLADAIQIEYLAPRRFDRGHGGAGASSDFDLALAEKSADADNDLVARLEQVDHACLHPGHARGADGKRERVLGLERLPQHFLGFVHQDQKVRIEMAHERRGHHGEHARMHVAGTGAEQQARRWIELSGSRHGKPSLSAACA